MEVNQTITLLHEFFQVQGTISEYNSLNNEVTIKIQEINLYIHINDLSGKSSVVKDYSDSIISNRAKSLQEHLKVGESRTFNLSSLMSYYIVEEEDLNTFEKTLSKIDDKMTKKLCEEFEIDESTVKKWEEGVDLPHHQLQNLLIEFIKERKEEENNLKKIKSLGNHEDPNQEKDEADFFADFLIDEN